MLNVLLYRNNTSTGCFKEGQKDDHDQNNKKNSKIQKEY